MRYFTSDLHLGSTLINKIAHRPFISAEAAVYGLIENINKSCSAEDMLIHVGDFMLSGKDRHGWDIDEGLKYTRDDYLKMIHTRIMLLAGNHDSGHNCDADGICLLLNLSHAKDVTVGHYPSVTLEDKDAEIPDNISHKHTVGYRGNYGDENRLQIHLCGHVHQHWLINYDAPNRILNINVGVDQWNYAPVSETEITRLIDWLYTYAHRKLNGSGFVWTRADFEHAQQMVQTKLKQLKAKRKAEKFKKKGLTPEECERRKREAMAKKGLK